MPLYVLLLLYKKELHLHNQIKLFQSYMHSRDIPLLANVGCLASVATTLKQIRKVSEDNLAIIFVISEKNICRGDSNEYPQHMFLLYGELLKIILYHQIPSLSVSLHHIHQWLHSHWQSLVLISTNVSYLKVKSEVEPIYRIYSNKHPRDVAIRVF